MSICSAKYTDPGTHAFLPSLACQLLIACRVRDWIHGVRTAAPSKVTRESLEAEPLYEAERLHHISTHHKPRV
jgi:hypothetical protein